MRSAIAALAAVSARLVGTVLTMVPKARFQGKYDEYHYDYGSARDPRKAAEHRPAMVRAERTRDAGNRVPDRHREVAPAGQTAEFDRTVVRGGRRRDHAPRPPWHRWRHRLVLACVLLAALGASAAADSAW